MPKVTVEVPKELKRLMDRHSDINWSEAIRQSIRRRARAAEIADEILAEDLDPDIREMTEKVKRGADRRYREALQDARRR